jgi:hypothetical protein
MTAMARLECASVRDEPALELVTTHVSDNTTVQFITQLICCLGNNSVILVLPVLRPFGGQAHPNRANGGYLSSVPQEAVASWLST